MNKNTEKALEFAVKKLIRVVEKTSDFAIEHAPDVLKEMVTEAKIGCAFAVAASALVLAACSVALYNLLPKAFQGEYGNFGAGITSFFAGLGAIGSLIVMVCCIETLVTLKYCPKLFLLKKLKELASPPSKE